MKEKFASAKKYVDDHKTAILVSALSITTMTVLLQASGIRGLNKFLDEKNLSDEYYCIEDV